MSMLTVRNLDPEVKSRLREQAARHGRSMEAEVRVILARAVQDPAPPDFVSALATAFSPFADDLPDFPRSLDGPRAVDL